MTQALSLMQRERLRSLGRRALQPGGASRYLPLELTPGEEYEETFQLDSVGIPEPAEWTFLFMGPGGEILSAQPVTSEGAQVTMSIDYATNAQLFVACRRGRDVGSWAIAPGPLATGPIIWRKPKRTDWWGDWLDLGPSNPDTKDLVILLKANERGNFQDGVAYREGDLVLMDGRQFYCICDTTGAPGSGPNLDPNDPNSNTILPTFYPYTTVTADDAIAPAAAAAPSGAGSAE